MTIGFMKRLFGASDPASNALKEAIMKETAANEVILHDDNMYVVL